MTEFYIKTGGPLRVKKCLSTGLGWDNVKK